MISAAQSRVRYVNVHFCRKAQLHISVFYWRHGPESQSIFLTFASTFLIKVRNVPSDRGSQLTPRSYFNPVSLRT
jgi:hypothetical protein